jgi:hypothetical protein
LARREKAYARTERGLATGGTAPVWVILGPSCFSCIHLLDPARIGEFMMGFWGANVRHEPREHSSFTVGEVP